MGSSKEVCAYEFKCPQRQEALDIEVLWDRVTGSCEVTDVDAGIWNQVLWSQYVLLIADTSL